MSGRVHVDRYIHFPTMAQYGNFDAFSFSSSVAGHISVVSLHFGHGVTVELHNSILNSRRIRTTNCSWSSFRTRLSRHLVIRHPRSQSASPLSVMVNFECNSFVALSDSSVEFVASKMSSTLVADIATTSFFLRV
jgi:hypothetical protein